jgi:outer membrane protein OmpA-like peptidoglycan-associated protein
MKRLILTLSVLMLVISGFSQITIIGHNRLNNTKLTHTKIFVRDGGNQLEKLETKNSADFMLRLNYGTIYRIYFQNDQCPLMFMEVIANNIPVDKQEYKMIYELNIPFFYRNDEDVDTSVFQKPFHKVIYNGITKMIEDTAYNNMFARRIIKSQTYVAEARDNLAPLKEIEIIIAGRACLNSNTKLAIINQSISLIGKNGAILKSTKTNRFGAFSFTGIKASEVIKIKIDNKNELNNAQVTLYNSENKKVISAQGTPMGIETSLKQDEVSALTDNNYSYNIGGKLILSSKTQKKFLANKTVYLSNKRNTVIRKTTTNMLGTFVFEDIRPDNTYFIGVDAKESGPGERIDFLNKDDKMIAHLDTLASERRSLKVTSDYNERFNDISISDDEMRMNVKAKLFGDNTNNPLGKLKILLLNDMYEVIDSAVTDDFGAFRFKYLPFLKRFYLSAENKSNILDVFNNILVYSNDDNMIKIMTHEKGSKFKYKPMPGEMNKLKDIEIEDPWLDFVKPEQSGSSNKRSTGTSRKTIIENILFETNKYELLPQAKEILDKVILVLNTNTNIRLEISAHTDSKGNDTDNLKLSQLRAKTTREYISAAGIEESRLISVGHGENRLLNKCGNNVSCSELEHAQNRRVEFKILEQ